MQHIERGSYLMENIAELQRDCDKVEAALVESKKTVKLLTKDLKAKQAALHRAVRASYEELPLFDGVEVNDTTDSPDICEEWRTTLLATLGLSNSILEKLANAGIHTLGDVVNRGGDFEFNRIDGIGPSAAEQISDACARYWQLKGVSDGSREVVAGGQATEPVSPAEPGDDSAGGSPGGIAQADV